MKKYKQLKKPTNSGAVSSGDNAFGAVSGAGQRRSTKAKGNVDGQETFHDAPDELHTWGKNGEPKTPIQEEPTGILPKVKNVVGEKNPQNPSREVIVKWNKPELRGNFQYIVYLEGDTKSKTEIIDSSKREACFKDLKSETQYIAYLSITKNDRKSEPASSKPFFTSKATRIPGFNIKEKGKPEITECRAAVVNNGESLVSRFTWSLPNLGVEKNNYNIVGLQATFKEEGGEVHELKLTYEVEAESVSLEFGTSYEFSVKRTYLDLDEHTMLDAICKRTLYTDIGRPKIKEVQWHDQEIVVTWSSAKGATNHTLKVHDDLGELVTEKTAVNGQHFTFPMTRSCNYGKMCILVIKASYMDKSTESDPVHCLIGGDMAVTDVVARKGDLCPRRLILVSWKPPKRRPQGYKVYLYAKEKDKYEESQEVTTLEQTHSSHKFTELKADTQYYCKVMPIYQGKPMDGSMSNVVKTDERIKHAFETEDDFGSPEAIVHVDKGSDSKGFIVKLSWKRNHIGENYKLSQQHLIVSQYNRVLRNTTIFDETLEAMKTEVEIKKLELGHKFFVKLTSTLIDLDTRKKSNSKKEYNFQTKPRMTQLHDCRYKNGLLIFSWKPVKNANKYRLEFKDEFLREEISEPEVVTNGKCEVEVQASEKLCIGRTCMTRVTAYVNDMTSETDWKADLIGGVLVPRNVKASSNSDKRSIFVTFDAPKRGPANEYKIVAKPEYGKEKTLFCSTNTVLFEFLRKGIKYKFQVHAKRDGKWSEGSTSNYQRTGGDTTAHPPVSLSGMKGTVNLQHAQVHGSTAIVNIPKGKEFGKIRDLITTLIPKDSDEKETLTLTWKVPTFDNNAFDYKVEKYEVEIRKEGSHSALPDFSLDFEKNLDKYSTDPQELELGETYEISVSTTYNDIDQDQEYTSIAEKTTVQTRPCKPSGVKFQVIKNEKDEGEGLQIEWNAVKGASYYEVEIYTDESETEPFKKKNTGKETKWSQIFGEGFGYGTSYYIVITAFGKGNKTNSVKTVRDTIGGDFSPKKVHATITHDEVVDPNTQVYLSWEPPTKQPESYEVSYENTGKIVCKNTNCLVKGLLAGEYYTFKVVAIHQTKNRSGGSISNKIQTNPTPTQVKNLRTSPGSNPSTSIKIYWDRVDAEKRDESTVYRVSVNACNKASSREIKNIVKESICVFGLEPDTEYFATVAGGNSIGFGKDSEKCDFKTDLGMPTNVQLLNNTTAPSTSLILKFLIAEGSPLKYIGQVYKKRNEEMSQNIDDVQSGHTFNDLEPNTDYFAIVYAVFENEKNGKAVKSEEILTAPSKPEIYEACCCIDNKINSSKDLYLKWKSDGDCTEHEVQIKREEVENQQIVKNKNELRYSCQHEASKYTARVRAKKLLFGPWSNEVVIDLAPKKLMHVTAELEKEGSNILIKCKKMTSSCLSYFCQAFCNDVKVGEPEEVQPKDSEDIVHFKYEPMEHAKNYNFKLWAADNKGLAGESALSGVVISRPSPGKIVNLERNKDSPSMTIAISWDPVEGCDEYEVKIKKTGQQKFESCVRTSETNCSYRCQSPGSKYGVRVRGICSSVRGNWSEKEPVELVPAEVELIEPGDEKQYVEMVQLKWKELEPKPKGYHIVLYQGENIIKDEKIEKTEHVFKEVAKPGLLYYCTVAGYNEAGDGKPVRTRNYRIKWNTPNLLMITHDENDPSRRAKISWDKPDGVNCFQLEIENNQLGTVTSLKLTENNYVFESGVPGNSYSVRLYCGCDDRYDYRCVKAKIAMKPEPPTNIKAVADSRISGITVTFKEIAAQQRSYEVCAKRIGNPGKKADETRVPTIQERVALKNLVPGASYEISVTSLANNERSKTIILDEYIQTFPNSVKNLCSKLENGIITYAWDPPQIPPDEYILYWKINSDLVAEESTDENAFTKRVVKGAQSYELAVAASNSAGKGKITRLETFVLVPNSVKNLCSKLENGFITYAWDPPQIPPDEYILYWKINNDLVAEESTDENTFTKRVVKGAQSYELAVAASNSAGKGKITRLETFVPVPSVVKNIHSKEQEGAIVYEWDALETPPDEYTVQWRVNNEAITEETTEDTKFEIRFLEPAHSYNLRVMASNSAGNGKMSPWNTFITNPLPPRNLRAISNKDSPTTSVIVKFEDDPHPLKEYRVSAVLEENGQDVEKVNIVTKEFISYINGLDPGRAYFFKVQTIFCGKKSREFFYTNH